MEILPLHLHHPSPLQACIWPSLRPPSLVHSLDLLAQPSHLKTICFGHSLNKIRGSLPIVSLPSRILTDQGGIGDDRIQLVDFCSRVYQSFSSEQSTAFYEFEKRHGPVAEPQYVLIWCWAAALGAGLLKTENFVLSASRLRVSFNIDYEEDTFNLLLDEAAEKCRLLKSTIPFVPYEVRAAKALDAICKCCIGDSRIDDEDARLLTVILQAVFPGANKAEMKRMVREKVIIAAVGDSPIQTPEQVDSILDAIKWDEKGLIVAIAQHANTGSILMQGFANRDAVSATIASGKATFYSRSRSSLWTKGETSSNFINVVDLFLDCDRDSIIYLGEPDGPTCHTGAETCYFTPARDIGSGIQVTSQKYATTTLYSLEKTIGKRKEGLSTSSKPSWTHKLLKDQNLLCSKIREEADELCRTLLNNEGKSRTASEMADVLYHAMVLLAVQDVKLEDVLKILQARFAQSGIEEKNSRK